MLRLGMVLLALTHFINSSVQSSDNLPQKRWEFSSVHMGTQWKIILYHENKAKAATFAKAAFARVAELELVMSDYTEKSELMQWCLANDKSPNQPRKLSADLFKVLSQSQKIAEASGGAFDVTVGPIVKLWRQARKTKTKPSPEDLATAKKRVGYQKVTLDPLAQSGTLQEAGMRLDLGGIGKGFAAAEAMKVLKVAGVTSALIAASGDITVSAAPPDQEAWIVEIAALERNGQARYLNLVNASVSTSGDLFQYVEIDGIRYSHVLDPRTGWGLTGYRSATVVAPTGWQADALTKVASVLPTDKALAVIAKYPGCETFIVVKENEDAKAVTNQSEGFGKLLIGEKN